MSFSTKLSLAMVLLIVWACGFSTEKRRPKRIEDTQEKREVKEFLKLTSSTEQESLGILSRNKQLPYS